MAPRRAQVLAVAMVASIALAGCTSLTESSNGLDHGAHRSEELDALVDEAQQAMDLGTAVFSLVRGSDVTGYVITAASPPYPDPGAIGLRWLRPFPSQARRRHRRHPTDTAPGHNGGQQIPCPRPPEGVTMNHTTARVARYAGAGIAGLATSCVLAAPAVAMLPPSPEAPAPGSEHQTTSTSTDSGGSTASTQASISSASDGIDWSVLAAGLAGGAILGGVVVVGASQVRRHQAHPA